uniref:Uncharacterized protein n=1 Tax=Ascaris lumbricoides TaxID=6252 RepID=A0A0M3IND4_ASCLU
MLSGFGPASVDDSSVRLTTKVSHSIVTDMPRKNCSRIDKALQWDMIANASLFKLVLTFYERGQHLTLQTGYVALGSALSGEELGPTHFSHNAA